MRIRQVGILVLSVSLTFGAAAAPADAGSKQAAPVKRTAGNDEGRLRDVPPIERFVRVLLKRFGVSSNIDTLSPPTP